MGVNNLGLVEITLADVSGTSVSLLLLAVDPVFDIYKGITRDIYRRMNKKNFIFRFLALLSPRIWAVTGSSVGSLLTPALPSAVLPLDDSSWYGRISVIQVK